MKLKHGKIISLLSALLAAVLMLLSLASCAEKDPFYYNREIGMISNRKTSVDYMLDCSYEARSHSVEPLTVVKVNDKTSITLYSIGSEDTSKYLCDGDGILYYSTAITLPTLSEMNVDTVYVCYSGNVPLVAAEIDDREDIDSLVSLYTEGENVSYPVNTPKRVFQLKFSSEEYSAFLYDLVYIEYETDVITTDGDGNLIRCGRTFVYNRYEGRCVAVGDEISKHLPLEE